MKQGRYVRVYPSGRSGQSARGIIVLISQNERSIVVGFDIPPPFPFEHTIASHPKYGIVFMAYRGTSGPWREMFDHGDYEIEMEAN